MSLLTKDFLSFMLLGSALLGAGQAQAGLFDDEEARKAILEIRQKAEVQRQELTQKLTDETKRSTDEEAQLRRSLVELQNQLELLKGDLAKLRGQDEQLMRDFVEIQRRYKDATQNFEDRLRKLEPTKVALDGLEFTVEPPEKRDYESVLAIFRKADFAGAQAGFVEFLNRYPKTGYRASALFWLGNAQYATKDYKESMMNFRALMSLSPDHARVPEALLAVANCQLELKDNRGAKRTLDDLITNHPTSEAAFAAKDRIGRIK
jgi:tol-pal system protein YbgF